MLLGEIFEQSGMFPGIRFSAEYPRAPAAGDTVVWKIVRRVPGAGRMRERKPRIRSTRYNPRRGEAIVRWAQVFTVIYQFDIISATNTAANELMERFEQFMLLCVEQLVARGVWQCLFEEQTEDRTVQVPQPLAVRTLRYRVVMESTIEMPVPMVKSFNVRMLGAESESVLALVRSSGNAEELGVEDCAIIYGVYDRDPGDASAVEYLCGVDWTLYRDPDSNRLYVLWLDDGMSPSAGATYYVRIGGKTVSETVDVT